MTWDSIGKLYEVSKKNTFRFEVKSKLEIENTNQKMHEQIQMVSKPMQTTQLKRRRQNQHKTDLVKQEITRKNQ